MKHYITLLLCLNILFNSDLNAILPIEYMAYRNVHRSQEDTGNHELCRALFSPYLNAILLGNRNTHSPADFFEREAKINAILYRISATELQTILGCHYPHVPTISAEDLLHKINNATKTVIINVLPKNLFDDCHIIKSISIPLKELVHRTINWPRDQEIIVYCALDICDASQKAYILLTCMGFTNVTDYEGGIKEWYQLGYPAAGPAASSFLHTKTTDLSCCQLRNNRTLLPYKNS